MIKSNATLSTKQQTWRQRLLQARLRPTPARLAMLSLFDQPDQPQLDADTLYLRLAAEGHRASLGTIYRILKELENHQLVIRDIDHQGRAWYMAWPSDTDSQHMVHMICRESGLALHLNAPELHKWVAEILAQEGWTLGLSPLTIQVNAHAPEGQPVSTLWDPPAPESRGQPSHAKAAPPLSKPSENRLKMPSRAIPVTD